MRMIGTSNEAEHVHRRTGDISQDMNGCNTFNELLQKLKYHTRLIEQKIAEDSEKSEEGAKQALVIRSRM